jgi:hypothetical protein
MYRRYEFVIESTEDEKVNLQRFLMEAHRLSITCFPSLSSDIIKNEVFVECPPSGTFLSSSLGSTGQ